MSIVAILILLAVAWSALSTGHIPNPFRARTHQGRVWRRTFPSASKRQIREFLAVFADAFAFRDTELLKFRPDDQLLGIYRSLYPSRAQADASQFQTLSDELRSRYGVTLEEIWNERMTLGTLFSYVQQNKHVAH